MQKVAATEIVPCDTANEYAERVLQWTNQGAPFEGEVLRLRTAHRHQSDATIHFKECETLRHCM